MSGSSTTPPEDPNELSGWKQIRSYLGVSEPVARKYYNEENLPVEKRGGRYYADKKKLDEWKWQKPGNEDKHLDSRQTIPSQDEPTGRLDFLKSASRRRLLTGTLA